MRRAWCVFRHQFIWKRGQEVARRVGTARCLPGWLLAAAAPEQRERVCGGVSALVHAYTGCDCSKGGSVARAHIVFARATSIIPLHGVVLAVVAGALWAKN